LLSIRVIRILVLLSMASMVLGTQALPSIFRELQYVGGENCSAVTTALIVDLAQAKVVEALGEIVVCIGVADETVHGLSHRLNTDLRKDFGKGDSAVIGMGMTKYAPSHWLVIDQCCKASV
jgi:hypothetical protein